MGGKVTKNIVNMGILNDILFVFFNEAHQIDVSPSLKLQQWELKAFPGS